ncbi:unnamed protein product [Blepharisma stoltei]|uniref:COPI associated protein n=1 Tax=Blepharisma stoltei TaxID=1481888 RepID=A0AAU9JSP6_9CILI|nr:unnamed protein product [Blepharisma stoltei]
MVDIKYPTLPKKWDRWLKTCSLVMAVFLILIGVFGLIPPSITDPINIILPVYYILFGLFIVGSELRLKSIVDKFLFIKGHIGRGFFYMFVATLCLSKNSLINYAIAIALFGTGILYISCYCGLKENQTDVSVIDQ